MPTAKERKPVYTALRRRNCSGALWKNVSDEDDKVSYRLSVTRSYRDAEGKWVNEDINAAIEDCSRLKAVLSELEDEAYALMQADYEASKASA